MLACPEINILNYVETFESYAHGFLLPGNGWSAASLRMATVTTNQGTIASYCARCGYPNDTPVHTKVLEVDGTVTNSFTMSAGQVVWVDKMMQANGLDTPNTDLANSAQAALYFNTDGHPVIRHRDVSGESNVWTEIAGVTATVNEWVRLTFKLDYQSVDSGNNLKYFQVWINGEQLTHALAWTDNDGSGVANGSWFAMPSAPSAFSRILFDGKGAEIDDLVVTTVDPFSPSSGTLLEFR